MVARRCRDWAYRSARVRISSSGVRPGTGIILRLSSGRLLPTETVRPTFRGDSTRRARPSACPEVEMVIRRGDMARPFSSEKVVMAAATASRLSSGSPMPMNTML